jgi:hypothetical protein
MPQAPRLAILVPCPPDLDLKVILESQARTSWFPPDLFFSDSRLTAPLLELMELASSPSLTSPRPGRSLLTLNMNTRKVPRQPAPHLQLVPTEEIEPASSIPFTPHSPFAPVSVSPLYSSTPVIRPRLAWSEERALRESLEKAFIGLDLRAQSFVENSPPLRGFPPRRSRSPSVSRLEVEEHARPRRWQDEGRPEETRRGRPRRGSTASSRGRGTAMKSLNALDSSRRRERN